MNYSRRCDKRLPPAPLALSIQNSFFLRNTFSLDFYFSFERKNTPEERPENHDALDLKICQIWLDFSNPQIYERNDLFRTDYSLSWFWDWKIRNIRFFRIKVFQKLLDISFDPLTNFEPFWYFKFLEEFLTFLIF